MTARGEGTRPDLLGDAQGFAVRRLGLAGLGGGRSGVDLAEDPQGVSLAVSLPRGARELEHALGSVPRLRQSAGEQVAFTERAQDQRQAGDDPDGGGLLRRLMFALRFRSTDTFFSPSLIPESRVMMYRRISERVKKIAPFLTYDPDPYVVVNDIRKLNNLRTMFPEMWRNDPALVLARFGR